MKLHDTPIPDADWPGAQELAADDTHRWLLVPMGFNLRLVGCPHTEPGTLTWPEFGWCYSRSAPHAPALALAAFDPVTQDEPLGWHKRAGDIRRAPVRAADPHHNRERCQHGKYLADRDCDPYCPDRLEAAP